jgi:hypothetical protein
MSSGTRAGKFQRGESWADRSDSWDRAWLCPTSRGVNQEHVIDSDNLQHVKSSSSSRAHRQLACHARFDQL